MPWFGYLPNVTMGDGTAFASEIGHGERLM